MKNFISHIFLLGALWSLSACEDIVFLPVMGTIEGTITDNNGRLVSGVTVTATFEQPGQQAFQVTKTGTSDDNGFYRISDLWDEVSLSVQSSGFRPVSAFLDLGKKNKPVLDFVLEGSPTIVDLRLDKTTLTSQNPDTLHVIVEVEDSFNSIAQGYTGHLVLKGPTGNTQAIVDLSIESQGLEVTLFSGQVVSTSLPSGAYQVIAEVKDPDGNTHQLQQGFFSVE